MERVAGGARRRIASARIAPPGVERRSADDPIAQGAVKCLLLGDRAARQIDQEGAGLHRLIAALAGVGRCFGWPPRAKVSMMIMRPPQQRRGRGSTRGSSAAAVLRL